MSFSTRIIAEHERAAVNMDVAVTAVGVSMNIGM